MLRKRRLFLLALMLGVILLVSGCSYKPPENLTPDQKMLILSKPAVVRPVTMMTVSWTFNNREIVTLLGSNPYKMSLSVTGSGWFISPDGYVVTNAHVAEYAHMQDKDVAKALLPYLYNTIAQRLRQSSLSSAQQNIVLNGLADYKVEKEFIVLTPGGEALPAEIKAYGVPIGEDISGKDVAVLKVEGKNFPTLTPGNSDDVKEAQKIFILGYPGAADFEGLFDTKSILESSASEGSVQARKNTAQGTPVIQIGGAANHGNSGGPIVNAKGQVIGILTFGKTEGVNFAVPMNTIMEFVRQAGANPGASPSTQKFQEAMDLYWSGRASKSLEKMQDLQILYPKFAGLTKFMQSAQAAKKNEPFMDPTLMLILIIAAVVVLGGGGAVAAIVLGKKKAAPAVAVPATAAMATAAAAMAPAPAPAAPAARPVTAYPSAPATAAPTAAPATAAPMPAPAVPVSTGPAAGGTSVLASGLGHAQFINGPLAGQRFEIPAGGCFIGREPGEGGLTVPHSSVSRQHCWVGPSANGNVVLVDRGSTNGTFINAIAAGRVQQVNLHPGDEVHLGGEGGVIFRYEA